MKHLDIEYAKQVAHLFPDAEWWWVKSIKQHLDDKDYKTKWRLHESSFLIKSDGATILHDHYPSPTTDDLLERLPYNIIIDNTNWALEICKWENGYSVAYGMIPTRYHFKEKSLPKALAKCLIFLSKEGLLDEN